MTAIPTAWRGLAAFLIFAGFCPLGQAQIDRAAYRYTTIQELISANGLSVNSRERPYQDTTLLAPTQKYRLQLTATGRIRELSPDTQAALTAWTPTHPGLEVFLKEYTHEVEVAHNESTLWLLWQRKLVVPFQVERGGGGDIDVYALLAGTFKGQLLLLATAFESVP